MKYLLLLLLLSGCGAPYQCIDGKLWYQLYIGSTIYHPSPSDTHCKDIKA